MENYQIILEPDEDIGFCARSNKMKGCFAEGDTIAESIFNFNKSYLMSLLYFLFRGGGGMI